MKKASIMIILAAVFTATAFGKDQITVKKGGGKMKYPGSLTNYSGFKVDFKAGVRQKSYHISEVISIKYDRNAPFTKAEKVREQPHDERDYSMMLAAYEEALKMAGKRWEQELIRHREYQMLDDAGRIDQAVVTWLKMMDRYKASKEYAAFLPDNLAASTAGKRLAAVSKLNAKAVGLERNREKNKNYLAPIYVLMLALQKSVNDKKGIAKTEKRIGVLEKGGDIKVNDTTGQKPKNGGTGGGGGAVRPVARVSADPRALEKVVRRTDDPAKLAGIAKAIEKNYKLYDKHDRVGGAMVAHGNALRKIYTKGGKVDKALLKRAGLSYMLAFHKSEGTEKSLEALYMAAEVNAELGQKQAARAAFRILSKFDWIKGSGKEWVDKAATKLKELKSQG